jgi:predicted nucleic acid-binding protein
MYVLDSSAIIELLNNGPLASKVARLAPEEDFVTTTISMHEVLVGAISEKESFIAENLFSGATVLEHTADAARAGALIQKQLNTSGTKINKMDVLIAGICRVNHAEVITLDRDFLNIKGLRVHLIQ